jgi:hypothetical protein
VAVVEAIDASFVSDMVYAVTVSENALALAAVRERSQKRFAIDLAREPFERGYVAVDDGVVRGFIGATFAEWNRRMTITHLCGSRVPAAGGGFAAHAAGGRVGAETAWAETSNRNYPGVEAYRRLGFSLCGFDLTLCAGTPDRDEFALYLSRCARSS